MKTLLNTVQANLRKATTTTGSAIKSATLTSCGYCATKGKAAGNSVTTFVKNIRAGEKLAEECEQVALMLKDASDKAELLAAAESLRKQASAIEAVAKSM